MAYALKKVSDKVPPDTDATQPLSTPELARQAKDPPSLSECVSQWASMPQW